MTKKQKILVTGSSGFLGSYLSKFLKSNKKYQITTTDKAGSPDLLGDLTDKKFVNSLGSYDVIVNCAAVQYVTSRKPIFFRKEWFLRNNVQSIENLVDKYKNKKTFFIHIGTSMQYKQNNSKFYDIGSAMGSQGYYSFSKIKAQEILDKNLKNLATVIPCIIGGKGREGLFRGFVKSINNYGTAFIPGSGSHKISIVHVLDVVNLISLIIKKKPKGYFNAAALDPKSIIQWVDMIGETLNLRNVTKFHIHLYALNYISKFFKYRILAQEQLIMLSMPHVLNIDSSTRQGWAPKYKTKNIISEITQSIIKPS
jgi:nucleoside-diphosphate-sugar epimerase